MPPKKSSSRSPVKKSKGHTSPTDSAAAAKAVPKPRRVIPSQSSSSSLPSFFDFVEPPPPDDDISAEPTFQVLPADDNPDLFLAATMFDFSALPDDPESEDDELDESGEDHTAAHPPSSMEQRTPGLPAPPTPALTPALQRAFSSRPVSSPTLVEASHAAAASPHSVPTLISAPPRTPAPPLPSAPPPRTPAPPLPSAPPPRTPAPPLPSAPPPRTPAPPLPSAPPPRTPAHPLPSAPLLSALPHPPAQSHVHTSTSISASQHTTDPLSMPPPTLTPTPSRTPVSTFSSAAPLSTPSPLLNRPINDPMAVDNPSLVNRSVSDRVFISEPNLSTSSTASSGLLGSYSTLPGSSSVSTMASYSTHTPVQATSLSDAAYEESSFEELESRALSLCTELVAMLHALDSWCSHVERHKRSRDK